MTITIIELIIGIILAFLIIIGALGLFIYMPFAVCYYVETNHHQRIKYEEFIKIAAVAPKKWEIACDGDYYYLMYSDKDNVNIIYMKTYFDELKLTYSYKKHNKLIHESFINKERAKLIKLWQADINNYHNEYINNIKDKIL